MYAFQDLRSDRVSSLHNLELANLTALQLPPGPKRDARNKVWEHTKQAAIKQQEVRRGGGPDIVPDDRELREQFQEIFEVWGYDARDAAEDWWIQWGALGERALGMSPEHGDPLFGSQNGAVNGTFSGVDRSVSVDG